MADTLSIATRAAGAGDLPAILELNARVFGPGRFTRTAYRIRERTRPLSRFCRVAVAGDRVIAALRFTEVLIGDAAAVTTPHVGAGTAKAVLAAWALADGLRAADHRDAAALGAMLDAWQSRQITRDRELVARGRRIGRRAQVEGTFTPGAPELSRISMPSD